MYYVSSLAWLGDGFTHLSFVRTCLWCECHLDEPTDRYSGICIASNLVEVCLSIHSSSLYGCFWCSMVASAVVWLLWVAYGCSGCIVVAVGVVWLLLVVYSCYLSCMVVWCVCYLLFVCHLLFVCYLLCVRYLLFVCYLLWFVIY
jgi:hypothetical protein